MTSLRSIALLFALGCGGDPSAPGPGDDTPQSFDHPIGAACDAAESFLCAQGLGACHDDLCVAFCSAIDFPRCPSATTEVHATAGDREVCLCAPS